MGDETLGAVEKALHLLNLFGQSTQQVQTLTELTRSSGLNKATCYRILSSLRAYGLVDREGDGYRLGFHLLELAARTKEQIPALNVGLPLMDRLHDEVNQSVQLVVRSAHDGVYVEVLPDSAHTKLYIRPGRRAPLYAGASTRLLLAALPDDEVLSVLREIEPVQLTSETPITESAIMAKVRDVRSTWFSLSLAELEPYSAELAAPLFDASGQIIAALSVAGTEADYARHETLRRLIVPLDATALSISRLLGYEGNWPTQPGTFLRTQPASESV